MDDLPELTLAMIPEARAFWDAHVRRADRGLLDTPQPDERRVERALDEVLRRAEAEADTWATSLAGGDITLDDYGLRMLHMIAMTRLCAIAAARGGWQHITAGDLAEENASGDVVS